ncbi:MAG: acyl-CoA/acyl-ACP dehydrogenase [Gammaproteobacteria bacterium]|nr:acyl-CoA/acyl-ACP dehydrogenase [Gammaproteobacteria bacterium]
MSELGSLLGETVDRIFADHITPAMREGPGLDAPASAGAAMWHAGPWDALEANGLTKALVPEAQGGAGAAWDDVYKIAESVGRAAAPMPLGETIVAHALLSHLTAEVPLGPLTIVADGSGLTLTEQGNKWTVQGTAKRIPWGRHAGYALAALPANGSVFLVLLPQPAADMDIEHNLAGEPRDTFTFDGAQVDAFECIDMDADVLLRCGALLRVAQATGAMSSVQSRALAYASERVQFGRALAKFQTIQHYLADLACHSAQAEVAASAAFRAMDGGGCEFEVAEAKVVVGEAIELATRIGHQIHGAIGFTAEHDLHYFTQRLWSWKAEFGSTAFWAERLGRAALARGADKLWSDITDRQAYRQ